MDEKLKIQLFYSKMGLPKCVRIISRKLQLDHTFYPAAGELYNLGPAEYMRLIREGVFDDVIILPEYDDEAYIKAPEPEGKMYLSEWISLSDYSEVIEY